MRPQPDSGPGRARHAGGETAPGWIDTHLHVGRLYLDDEPGLPPEVLLAFMDANGIDRAVLLPIESPECTSFYVPTTQVLDICRRWPVRFIPFCNVDPRRAGAVELLGECRRQGCKGYGEAMSGLWIDDERLQAIYEACGELGMPVLFDIDREMNLDEPHLPRLERMVAEFPQTAFIGHGPMFWAEISGDFSRAEMPESYPAGPVAPGGAVCRLLSTYANLHADLSARSGWNALARDAEFAPRFCETFRDRLMFGTDLCHSRSAAEGPPIAGYLLDAARDGAISAETLRLIGRANAVRLLALEA